MQWEHYYFLNYQMRKNYDIGSSKLHSKDECNCNGNCDAECECDSECDCQETLKDGIYLFGTKTCPNCAMAKKLLEKDKVKYQFIDAEENVALTKECNVTSAPTLVVIKKGKSENIINLSNIKKYLEKR